MIMTDWVAVAHVELDEEEARGESLRVMSVSRIEGAERIELESVADLRSGDRFLMTVEGVY